MNNVKKVAKESAKALATVPIIVATAAKYGLTFSESFLSGANNLAGNFSGYNGKNVVTQNLNKIAGKALDTTVSFFNSLKKRIDR